MFEVAADFAAELGAGTPEVVAAEVLDADLARGLLNNVPHGPVAEAVADFAPLADLPQQRPLFGSGRRLPGSDGVLDPQGHSDGADAAARRRADRR